MTKVVAKHAIFLLIIQTNIICWREFVPITEYLVAWFFLEFGILFYAIK
jgi:hypothetical protein